MIQSGDPGDADAIRAELGRMVEAAQRIEVAGGEGMPAFQEAIDVASAYGRSLVEHLRNDPAFQNRLRSGLASDLDDIADLLGVLTGLARQIEIMGREADAEALGQAWLEWFRVVSASIGATCGTVPIDNLLALRFARQAALLGEEGVLDDLQSCLPTPPPICSDGHAPAGISLAVTLIPSAVNSECGPPGFVGDATYTSNVSQSEIALIDSITIGAANVIWEPEGTPGAATRYHAVSGRLTFAREGRAGECTIQGHGSASIVAASAATDLLLFVDFTGPAPTYGGFARAAIPVTTSTTCGNDTFDSDAVTSLTWLNVETVDVVATGGVLGLQGLHDERSPRLRRDLDVGLRASMSDPRAVVERLTDAQNARDLEGMVSCFADDYRSEQPMYPTRAFRGVDQVRKNWTALFESIPDFHAEVVRSAVDGDTIFVEIHWTGTKEDGTPLEERGVLIMGTREDRVAWARIYAEEVESQGANIDAVVRRMAGSEA